MIKIVIIMGVVLCMFVLGCTLEQIQEGDSIEQLTLIKGKPHQIVTFYEDEKSLIWIPESTEDKVDHPADVLIYYYNDTAYWIEKGVITDILELND